MGVFIPLNYMYYVYTNKNLDTIFGTGANVFTDASTLKN